MARKLNPRLRQDDGGKNFTQHTTCVRHHRARNSERTLSASDVRMHRQRGPARLLQPLLFRRWSHRHPTRRMRVRPPLLHCRSARGAATQATAREQDRDRPRL